jgi:transcriptional regulator with XRE-family HTH domain
MNNDYFISELRKALLAQGLNQKEIATKSGLSQSVVCKFFKGHNPNIRFHTVVLLWPIAFGTPFPNIKNSEKADT